MAISVARGRDLEDTHSQNAAIQLPNQLIQLNCLHTFSEFGVIALQGYQLLCARDTCVTQVTCSVP